MKKRMYKIGDILVRADADFKVVNIIGGCVPQQFLTLTSNRRPCQEAIVPVADLERIGLKFQPKLVGDNLGEEYDKCCDGY